MDKLLFNQLWGHPEISNMAYWGILPIG